MGSGWGDAAAGFMRGFSGARGAKKEREENEKYKKAMTQLLELQIDAQRKTRDAQTKVGTMMAPQPIAATPPEFAMPPEGQIGEITTTKPAGPMVNPGMSFMDIMSDPQGRFAALESGMSQQLQQADQLTAKSELVKGMQASGKSPLEFLNTPEGGSLAVRAGMDPSQLMKQGGDPNDALDALLAQVNIKKGLLDIEGIGDKKTQEAADTAKAHRQHIVQTKATVNEALELMRLNDDLEGSFLETGQPFGEIYRAFLAGGAPVLERLGFDTKKTREVVAKFDRFKKLSTGFGIDQLDRFQKGTGTVSQTKFQALQQSLANIGASPGANRLAISDVLQAALDDADIEEIDVPDRAEAEEIVRTARRGGGVRPPAPTAVDVPATAQAVSTAAQSATAATTKAAAEVMRMGMAQIHSLKKEEIASWSEEQRAALSKRLEELGF